MNLTIRKLSMLKLSIEKQEANSKQKRDKFLSSDLQLKYNVEDLLNKLNALQLV